jgi:hypothetical protein
VNVVGGAVVGAGGQHLHLTIHFGHGRGDKRVIDPAGHGAFALPGDFSRFGIDRRDIRIAAAIAGDHQFARMQHGGAATAVHGGIDQLGAEPLQLSGLGLEPGHAQGAEVHEHGVSPHKGGGAGVAVFLVNDRGLLDRADFAVPDHAAGLGIEGQGPQ